MQEYQNETRPLSTMEQVKEILAVRDQAYQERETRIQGQLDNLQKLSQSIKADRENLEQEKEQFEKDINTKQKELEQKELLLQEKQEAYTLKKTEYDERERKILYKETELMKEQKRLEEQLSEQMTQAQLEYERAKNESLKIISEREELESLRQNLDVGLTLSVDMEEVQHLKVEIEEEQRKNRELQEELAAVTKIKEELAHKYINLKKEGVAQGEGSDEAAMLKQQVEEKEEKIRELEKQIENRSKVGEGEQERSIQAEEIQKKLASMPGILTTKILHNNDYDTVEADMTMKKVFICLENPCFIVVQAERDRKVKVQMLADLNTTVDGVKFYATEGKVSAEQYFNREIPADQLLEKIKGLLEYFN